MKLRQLFLGFLSMAVLSLMAQDSGDKTTLMGGAVKKLVFNGDQVTVTFTDGTKEPQTFNLDKLIVKMLLKGDANGDGKVTYADAVAVANYIMNDGHPTAEKFNAEAANVTGGEEITISDAAAIVNMILKENQTNE